MRKPAFCKCENKDADQLHGQGLCFRCTDSTIPLLPKSEAPSDRIYGDIPPKMKILNTVIPKNVLKFPNYLASVDEHAVTLLETKI